MSYKNRYFESINRAVVHGGSTIPSDITSLITATGGQLRTLAGPDAQFSAVAGQVPDGLGGVQASTIAPVQEAGYYGGPAYTNLFAGGPTAPEAKSLTAQKYCLQCVGGSVDAGAYGTATPSAPLIFTASAGSQTFTPTGCTAWMLTAAGGYVYPIIPPGQSVVSTIGTTGGNGVSIPLTGSAKADTLIACYRGVPDGVDTLDLSTPSNIGVGITNSGGGLYTYTSSNGQLAFTGLGIGKRYLLKFSFVHVGGTIYGNLSQYWDFILSSSGDYQYEFTANDTVFFINSASVTGELFLESIRELTSPATGTVAVLMRMGVGNTELTPSTEGKNVLSVGDSAFVPLYFRGGSTDINATPVNGSDGSSYPEFVGSWSSHEYHLKVVEYNGTKFRVGNQRFNEDGTAIDAGMVWSHATLAGGANFDGSFDPTTFERWFLNSTVPNHMRARFVSNQAGLGDAEIIRRLRKYGKF